MNRWSARFRKSRRGKCKASPPCAMFCDGCRKTSSKCPMRYKTRDLRHKYKIIPTEN